VKDGARDTPALNSSSNKEAATLPAVASNLSSQETTERIVQAEEMIST
jgi:hypothetical protein